MESDTPGTTIADRALEFIHDSHVVGLGSGRAAMAFVYALGDRVKGGLRIRGVPTSETTAEVGRSLGIPLLEMDEANVIDVTVDGADEVDPNLNLIKGYGGALVREKIVAAASRELIILIGSDKLVQVLGERGKLPVEVIPFALALCRRRLLDLACQPKLRLAGGDPFVSDNGNYILDCEISPLEAPEKLERSIRSIPGVVGTGLFLGMADFVLIQQGATVEVRKRGG